MGISTPPPLDGVIIDPTAGQFEQAEPALMISWPDSPAYARYMPWRLQTSTRGQRFDYGAVFRRRDRVCIARAALSRGRLLASHVELPLAISGSR